MHLITDFTEDYKRDNVVSIKNRISDMNTAFNKYISTFFKNH